MKTFMFEMRHKSSVSLGVMISKRPIINWLWTWETIKVYLKIMEVKIYSEFKISYIISINTMFPYKTSV